MPTTEAYRPGLLSSLLLGEGVGKVGAGAGAGGATGATGSTVLSGEARPLHDPAAAAEPSSGKKKKKSKKNKREDGEAAAASAGAAAGPPKENVLVAAAPVPAEGVAGLASLFSPSNLTKFKRRERADKDADAAEVRLVSGIPVGGDERCSF